MIDLDRLREARDELQQELDTNTLPFEQVVMHRVTKEHLTTIIDFHLTIEGTCS
jgi:hypothetical protein